MGCHGLITGALLAAACSIALGPAGGIILLS
jgi:hypothetical protein